MMAARKEEVHYGNGAACWVSAENFPFLFVCVRNNEQPLSVQQLRIKLAANHLRAMCYGHVWSNSVHAR
jgi:hypothetical protein